MTSTDGAPSEQPHSYSADPAEPLPSGWTPLIRNFWKTEFTTATAWLAFPVLVAGNTASFLASDLPWPGRLLVMLGTFAAGSVLIALWFRFRPVPRANFDTSQLRLGRRTIAMSEIRWARLVVVETAKRRSITLQFGPGELQIGAVPFRLKRATYVVRTARDRTPQPAHARLVAEALRRSSIELPGSPDDPGGRFTWFNFPGAITREQAITIVTDPPAFGEPIPLPPTHMFDSARYTAKKAPTPETEN